jgi:hypothetical protein
MSTPDARLLQVEVPQIVASYAAFLERARSGVPHLRSPTPDQAFRPNPRTDGFYIDYRQHGHVRWLIQFEDDRLGDWLCVDPRNHLVPTFPSIPAAKQLLDTFGLTDRLLTHLETADLSIRLKDARPDPVDLDRLELWLQQPDSATIHYDQFMRLWQLFDMLPPMAQASNEGGWLTSATYQHLWLGIYAPRVDIPIPLWSADELSTLHDTLRSGSASFPACTYPAA